MKETPMMTQYLSFKKQYPDKIVLFRMGDFFETFGEEPIKAEVLDFITAIRDSRPPKVGAKEAYLSFETADNIEKAISKG